MDRKEIISNPGYWTTDIQIKLFRLAEDFMKANGMNRKQLAEHLGVSPGYVTQLLSGDYDHRISKMVELALAFGCVPEIQFENIEKHLLREKIESIVRKQGLVTYKDAYHAICVEVKSSDYTQINDAA